MTNIATNPRTRISIKGAPRKYDANELLQRQQGYHSMYRSTDQNCEMVRGELPYLFLTKVIEKVSEGYILTDRYRACPIPRTPHPAIVGESGTG